MPKAPREISLLCLPFSKNLWIKKLTILSESGLIHPSLNITGAM